MTTTHKFSIGDRVRVKPYADLPDDVRTKGASALCGQDGEIVDIIYSNANHKLYYVLQFDGYSRPSTKMFTEDSIDFIPEEVKPTYRYDFSFLENVVVASLIEIDGDGNETELAKAHGHHLHDGAYGIAQAASRALKKIMQEVQQNENA